MMGYSRYTVPHANNKILNYTAVLTVPMAPDPQRSSEDTLPYNVIITGGGTTNPFGRNAEGTFPLRVTPYVITFVNPNSYTVPDQQAYWSPSWYSNVTYFTTKPCGQRKGPVWRVLEFPVFDPPVPRQVVLAPRPVNRFTRQPLRPWGGNKRLMARRLGLRRRPRLS
jgi:hypothetical protein